MSNFLKLAALHLEANSDDVVKTAGVLSRIKSWLANFFDRDRADRAAKLLDRSSDIKELIEQLKTDMANIETSISDANISGYDLAVEDLKKTINKLNAKLGSVINEGPGIRDESPSIPPSLDSIPPPPPGAAVAPTRPGRATPWSKKPRETLPESYPIKPGETLESHGITKESIALPNNEQMGGLHKSMEKMVEFLAKKKKYTEDVVASLKKDFHEVMTPTFMKEKIYDQLTRWAIKDVKGRTLSSDGTVKAGNAEILLESYVQVKTVEAVWQFRINMLLVDHSNPVEKIFNIWTQEVKEIRQVL